LASIALTVELLPEVKAKVIVVPTLILMIVFTVIDLKRRNSKSLRYEK